MDSKGCPKCGTPTDAERAGGLCPACLPKDGLHAAAAHLRVGSSSGRAARDCDDFKVGVVRLILDEGKTVGGVARDMDMTESARHAALSKTGSWLGEARIVRCQLELCPSLRQRP